MRVIKNSAPPRGGVPLLSDPGLTADKKGAVEAAIAFFQQQGCRVLPARDDLPFDPAAAEFRLVLAGNLAVLPVSRISLVERAVRRAGYLAGEAAQDALDNLAERVRRAGYLAGEAARATAKPEHRRARGSGACGR